MKNTQIEISNRIIELVRDVIPPITSESLVILKEKMYSHIVIRPYDNSTKGHEKQIRWKRTSAQILEDGYVYNRKSCTDLIVLFLALCSAINLETRFVKLYKEKMVHSVAEIKLSDGWYIFDVSNKTSIPIKGEISVEKPYKDWTLWKKGRDAWDLDLTDLESITKIER